MEDIKSLEILEGKYNLLDELQRLMIGMNQEEKTAYLEKNAAMVQLLQLYQEQADVIKEQKESFEAISSFEEKLKKIYGGVETVGGGFNDVMEKLGGGKFTKALGIEDALKSTRKFSADLINSGKYTRVL